MKHSKRHSLNWYDLVKGLFIAFVSSTITGVTETLSAGHLPDALAIKKHVAVGLSAAGAYMIKQFFTNSEGAVLKKESKTSTFKDRA